jgi:hypothetical protein
MNWEVHYEQGKAGGTLDAERCLCVREVREANTGVCSRVRGEVWSARTDDAKGGCVMFVPNELNKWDIWVYTGEEVSQSEVDFINEHFPEEVEVALRNLVQAARALGVK